MLVKKITCHLVAMTINTNQFDLSEDEKLQFKGYSTTGLYQVNIETQ